jgi:hypothetical protein
MAAADDEPTKPTPPADTPPKTQNLQPGIVRDPDILVQTKADANERRRLAHQLPDKVLAAIHDHLADHSDASNNAIARWLKDNPEIAPLVEHLKLKSLADKIGKLRK